jgi:hypothetical protein
MPCGHLGQLRWSGYKLLILLILLILLSVSTFFQIDVRDSGNGLDEIGLPGILYHLSSPNGRLPQSISSITQANE